MQGLLIVLGLFVCYLVGRAALNAMGVIMIGSLSALIIRPIIMGFFIVFIGGAIVVWIFKALFSVLGWLIGLIFACIPFIIIIGLVIALVKAIRRR